MWLRWFAFPVLALAGLGVLSLALAGFVILLAYPNLPSIEALTEYQPKIPLRVYTADGLLIGEFGEERRSVVSIEEVPALMKQAILAAEDERFYQHTGVDYHGVLRAAYSNLVTGGKTRGIDDHDAGRAKLFSFPGKDADPQIVRGAAGVQDRK